MKLATGHPVTRDEKIIEGDAVRFLVGDRAMFEVRINKDGRSIEVRAVEACRVDGVMYGTQMQITPHVSNSVSISAAPFA